MESGQASQSPREEEYRFTLYVTGLEGNSQIARRNLKDICEEYLKGHYSIGEVDVLQDFDTALKNGVFVSPTLVLTAPEPKVTIVGNLGNREKVLMALRIKA